jgi:glucose-1-phosphate adenylyltransferase
MWRSLAPIIFTGWTWDRCWRYHVEKQAHVTISALPVPISEAKGFGILNVSKTGRMTDFEEKPKNPKPMPGDPDFAFSSMGNYIFNRDVLEEALTEDLKKESGHDFGKNILPAHGEIPHLRLQL